jgi:hypothetical protein
MGASVPGWYPDPIDASLRRWWDGDQWTLHVSRDGKTWALPLRQVAPVKRRRRLPTWAWVLLGVLALALALALSPLVAAVALVVLITGIVALAKGTPTWLRLRSKRAAGVVTAVSAAAFLVFGGVAAAVQPDGSETQLDAARFADADSFTSGRDTGSERGTTSSPTPTPTPTPVTTVEEEIVTESVAFDETTVDDADLPKGQSQVTTPGRAGERTLTYRVTVVDGVETGRELISDVVTTEPVTQVTAVGTYVEPPPPPAPEPEPAQPSGCNPNYADACVPVSSDVDCAGGSGNGPAYFDGIARVVGSDIYQLDRDGDGFACEPN